MDIKIRGHIILYRMTSKSIEEITARLNEEKAKQREFVENYKKGLLDISEEMFEETLAKKYLEQLSPILFEYEWAKGYYTKEYLRKNKPSNSERTIIDFLYSP